MAKNVQVQIGKPLRSNQAKPRVIGGVKIFRINLKMARCISTRLDCPPYSTIVCFVSIFQTKSAEY